jgi:hypothetical protein
MPRRTAPMSASFSPLAPSVHSPCATASSETIPLPARLLERVVRATLATALLGTVGLAFAQTPVCFDSVGRALAPEQCSQAARDQAAAQATTSGVSSPSLRDECRALADKIANTPDKPVYTRDRPVVAPNGNRVDIPTRSNPRKALKEEYVRKCT